MSKLDHVEEVAKAPVVETEHVFITIPEVDIYDNVHPGVRLNRVSFDAGKTYKVPPDIGAEVQDRLDRFEKESIRLLRPKTDQRAINDVNRGSQWSSRGGGSMFSLEGGLKTVGGANDRVITIDHL